MFADFPSTDFTKSAIKLSKILFLPYTAKPHLKQSSTAENWLVGPKKNTGSTHGVGPLFRGIRMIAHCRCTSTKIRNL